MPKARRFSVPDVERGIRLKHNPVSEADFLEKVWDAFSDYAIWVFGGMLLSAIAFALYSASPS
jgi:hypothetical protein